MKVFWGLIVLLVSVEGSLIEFGKMIKEETGKPIVAYTFYGCYCGLGGKGRPRDATDRCCLTHDCCYEKLTNCKPKTDQYKYTRQNGVISCGGRTWCEKQICECDKAAAICFRNNLNTYNERYQYYLNINCNEGPKKC